MVGRLEEAVQRVSILYVSRRSYGGSLSFEPSSLLSLSRAATLELELELERTRTVLGDAEACVRAGESSVVLSSRFLLTEATFESVTLRLKSPSPLFHRPEITGCIFGCSQRAPVVRTLAHLPLSTFERVMR